MSDEKTATKTILLSDGTAVEFRELTKSEWERMERIKFGGSLEIGGETLTRDAVLMAWTITRAVLSPPDITNVLLSGMEEGRIAETEMIDLHNAILDFTAERVLARDAKGAGIVAVKIREKNGAVAHAELVFPRDLGLGTPYSPDQRQEDLNQCRRADPQDNQGDDRSSRIAMLEEAIDNAHCANGGSEHYRHGDHTEGLPACLWVEVVHSHTLWPALDRGARSTPSPSNQPKDLRPYLVESANEQPEGNPP